jgi:hypothetical protein
VAESVFRCAVAEHDPGADACAGVTAITVETSSYLRERRSRSINTLSIHRPTSTLETRIPAAASTRVNAAPGELTPLIGAERSLAAQTGRRLRASTVLDRHRALWLMQSIAATR